MNWNAIIMIAPFALLFLLFTITFIISNEIGKFLNYDYEYHQYRDKEYHEMMRGKGTWKDIYK